jgi:hypothetical protein
MLSLAGFSDFARHYFRNLGWCLFLELLRCFSSPGLPRTPMYSVCDTFRWVSPFRDLRVTGYLPPRRSLSQAFTSFVAYHCQGIHHMLLVTWPYNFDFSRENTKLFSRTAWLALTLCNLPIALCRNWSMNIQITFYLIYKTTTCVAFCKVWCLFLTQSKISMPLAARATKTFTNLLHLLAALIYSMNC